MKALDLFEENITRDDCNETLLCFRPDKPDGGQEPFLYFADICGDMDCLGLSSAEQIDLADEIRQRWNLYSHLRHEIAVLKHEIKTLKKEAAKNV